MILGDRIGRAWWRKCVHGCLTGNGCYPSCHKMMVLEPPEDLVGRIQKQLVDFFWSGQHWLRAAVLYLPTQEGGQGLVDIGSRVKAFRLQTIQRLLYGQLTM